MGTLHITQQHPPCVITGAATGFFLALPQLQLVAVASGSLYVYTSTEAEGLQLLQTVQLFELFDAAFTIAAAEPGKPDRLLLVSGQLGRCVLVTLAQSTQGHITCTEELSATLTQPEGDAVCKRMDSICCSKLWSPGPGCTLLSVALYVDHVHVVRLTHAQPASLKEQLECVPFNLRHCSSICKPGQAHAPAMVGVLAMEFMPCSDVMGQMQGSVMLAALFRVAGSGYMSTDVECMELLNALPHSGPTPAASQPHPSAHHPPSGPSTSSSRPPTSSCMQLCEGPWSCRNLHPTARLLHHLPASAVLSPGLLVISSTSILLIIGPSSWDACMDPPGAAQDQLPGTKAVRSGQPSSGGIAHHELVKLSLAGLPTCLELVPGPPGWQLLLLGDSMAGLYLLQLGGPLGSSIAPITIRGPVSPPSLLHYIPPAAPQALTTSSPSRGEGQAAEPQPGYLFLASQEFNCQLLQLPTFLASLPIDTSLTFTLVDGALIKSLAPVRSVVMVPDSQGAADPTLMVGAGTAPWGRLARAKLAVALAPYFPSGTTLPESVQLFGIGGPAPSITTHLAFSFGASGRTEVLGLEGETFRQVSLPGFDGSSRSLLVASIQPSGLVAQVVPVGVRLLGAPPEGRLLHTWEPPSGAGAGNSAGLGGAAQIALAAAARDVIVVATVDRIFSLQVDASASPSLRLLSSVAVHQTSALNVDLHLLSSSPGSTGAGGSSTVAVIWGQWVSNRLVVAAAVDLAQPLLVVDLGAHTARSAVAMPLPGARCALAAGTNSGAVLLWDLEDQQQQPEQQPVAAGAGSAPRRRAWHAGQMSSVQVSSVAVRLSLVSSGSDERTTSGTTGSWPYIYAHSGQATIIRLHPICAHLNLGPASDYLGHNLGPSAAQLPWTSAPLSSLLQAVRVHGSSWLHDACPIHAKDMPHSWAWVTAANQLMFGRVHPQLQLRYTTALIGDTPHCVAYHSTSRCYVLLTEDVSRQQTLRLVHGETLQALLSMKLSPGHRYTTLKVCHLPCTSTSPPDSPGPSADPTPMHLDPKPSQPNQFNHPPPPGTKEFIVMASYLLHDGVQAAQDPSGVRAPARDHASAQRAQGLLSFFQVTVARSSAPGTTQAAPSIPSPSSSSEVRYSLLLHGVAPIPSIATSLEAVTPRPCTPPAASSTPVDPARRPRAGMGSATSTLHTDMPAVASSAPEGAPVVRPHLVVGCSDGLYVYGVTVDDGRCAGPEAAAELLAAAAVPPERPSWAGPPARLFAQEPGVEADGSDEEMEEELLDEYMRLRAEQWAEDGEGDRQDGAGQAAAMVHMEALLTRNWSQHVSLTEVASGHTFASFAATRLSAFGSLVLASDLLASVSLFSFEQRQGKPGAPPVVSLRPVGADHMPVYTQAALSVSEDHVLASVHPHGLVLLGRDRQLEGQFSADKAREEERAALEHGPGSRRIRLLGPADAPPAPSSASDAAPLDILAACRVRHAITHLIPGRLGLQLRPTGTGPEPTAAADGMGGGSAGKVSLEDGNSNGYLNRGAANAEDDAGTRDSGRQPVWVTGIATDGSVSQVAFLNGPSQGSGSVAVAPDVGPAVRGMVALQGALEVRQAELGLGLPQTAPLAGRWGLAVMRETSLATVVAGMGEEMVRQLPGNCLDGALLLEGLARGVDVDPNVARTLMQL